MQVLVQWVHCDNLIISVELGKITGPHYKSFQPLFESSEILTLVYPKILISSVIRLWQSLYGSRAGLNLTSKR